MISRRPNTGISRRTLLAMFALACLLFPARGWAYIDPGSGSYLLQVILAFFFGALFVMKSFWKKAARKIAGLIRKEKADDRRPPDP